MLQKTITANIGEEKKCEESSHPARRPRICMNLKAPGFNGAQWGTIGAKGPPNLTLISKKSRGNEV